MVAFFRDLQAEYLFLQALQKAGDHDRALRILEQAHHISPAHYGIALQLGHFRLLAGDLQGALTILADAESLKPALHVPAQYQGILHLLMKETDEAERCFDRALSLSPHNQLNKNYRSLCAVVKGDFAGGTEGLRKDGIYSNPRFVGLLMTALEEAVLQRAMPAAQAPVAPVSGENQEAAEVPEEPPSPSEPGAVPQAEEPPSPAVPGAVPQVEEPPSPPSPGDPLVIRMLVYPCCAFFYWFLGQHYMNREKFPPAANCFRKVLHYASSTQRINFHLGEALFYGKVFDEAFTQFSLSLKIDGESPEVLYYMGRLYQMRGEYEEAADHLSRSLEKFAKSPETLLSLGQIALAEGDRDRARGHFTLAADYDFTYILERIHEIESDLADSGGPCRAASL